MLIQDQVNVFQWLLYIKILWALVGTLSDFETLFRHNTTKRCPIHNLGLRLFLLPSGWEKVIFLQGTLSSILATCPDYFNLAILIIFTVFGYLYD